jgi:hypothetical protein
VCLTFCALVLGILRASPPLGRKAGSRKCALKGSKHALNFFRVALPHRYLHIGSSTRKTIRNIPCNDLAETGQKEPNYITTPDSQKWHDSLNHKWMRPRNVGAARATVTRVDSEWSQKFEEPWPSRPRDWRGVGQVFSPRPR